MAYKFQLGSAILSGSTKFEEGVELTSLKFSGSVEDSIDIAADSILFRDADGSVKSDTLTDYAALIAGDGLGASGGALSVGVDDSSIETSGDALRVKALGVTNAMLAGSIADSKLNQITTADKVAGSAVELAGTSAIEDSTGLKLKAATAGDGLAMNSQVLSVNVDDSTIETDSDTLQLKDDGVTGAKLAPAVAAGGLTQDGSGNLQVGAGSLIDVQADQVDVDLTEAAAATVADGDFLIFLDGGSTGAASKGSTQDLATLFAGEGLSTSSSRLAVAVSGAMAVESDKVGISGSIAGAALTFSGGAASISKLDVAVNSTSFAIASDEIQLKNSVAGDGLSLGSHALSVNVDDSTIETNSDTLQLKDNGVTLAKLAGITRGSIIIGDSSGDPSLLAKGTEAQFLQSDGTDPSYVTISGDATVAAGGALTIAADAVESGMLNDNIISGQTELAHADIVDADELMISDGGVLKRVGVDSLRDHFFGVVSGDATIADGGALTIGANAVEDSMVHDNVATGLAGVGLGASGGVLAVQVSGAIVLDNDRLGLSGSLAGKGLMFEGGAESLSSLEVKLASNGGLTKGAGSSQKSLAVDLNGLAAVPDGQLQVDADFFAVVDTSDSNKTKKESIADLMTAVAGNGLAAASGVLSLDASEVSAAAIASGDHFVFHDVTDDSTKKETVDDLATFMAGPGLGASSGELSIDLNELGAATVDVANDSLAIIDATDNTSKKEAIADIVGAMAGAGLTATSGVLSVTGNNVALKADGDTLAEGYNYFADASANATVSLPALPEVGDVVVVKARDLTSGAKIIINRQGSHKIDGQNSVEIESPFGAITCVYVVANDWRIV